MAKIAIDFDRVIHDRDHPLGIGKMGAPMPGTAEALSFFRDRNDDIVVFTARDKLDPVEDWMTYYKLPFDRITNVKPECDYYIDDKAIRFESWTQVLHLIIDMERYARAKAEAGKVEAGLSDATGVP